MKKIALALPALMAGAALAQTPAKVGVIDAEAAIVSTKEGQKAFGELQAKYSAREAELKKKDDEVAGLKAQLAKGSNAMSDEQRNKLMREIDSKGKTLSREVQDYQEERQQEMQKVGQDIWERVRAVMDKYAKDNGFAVVFNLTQGGPVVWRADAIDITEAVVALYNKSAPAASAPAASSPAVSPPPSTTKPSTPVTSPAVKKK